MDWTSTLFGVLGVSISIFIAYDHTRKNIEKIIARDFEGNLTKDQALSLVDIYINIFKKETKYQINKIFDYDLEKYKDLDTSIIWTNIVNDNYRYCATEIRNKFQFFRLRGGIKFVSIFSDICLEPVESSLKEMETVLNELSNGVIKDQEIAKSKIYRCINDANSKGEKLIKEQIEKLYNR